MIETRTISILKLEAELKALELDILNFQEAISNTSGEERLALEEVKSKCERVYIDGLVTIQKYKQVIYN